MSYLFDNNVNETRHENWYTDLAPHMHPFSDNIVEIIIPGVQFELNLYTRNFISTNTESNVICEICLAINNNDVVSSTVCDHIFHNKCIKCWINANNFNGCPTCRNNMEQPHMLSALGIQLNKIKKYTIIILLFGVFPFILLLSKSI